MLSELQRIFKRPGLLEEAVQESHEMLRTDWEMFKASIKSLRESETGEIDIDIETMDIQINKYERDVRKKVLTHLAVGEPSDLNIGLILINTVIDIERIGDYTKNIVTLAQNYHTRLELPEPEWEKDLKNIEETISKSFGDLIDALETANKDTAGSLLRELWGIKKTCSRYTAITISDNPGDLRPREAVVFALYLRYLKRIASHLMNIATSIVNPFHKIGYRATKEVDL